MTRIPEDLPRGILSGLPFSSPPSILFWFGFVILVGEREVGGCLHFSKLFF